MEAVQAVAAVVLAHALVHVRVVRVPALVAVDNPDAYCDSA